MNQWHPIFAHLLRPLVEDYFEVRTDLPVGELPRPADIVLVRRTASASPVFVHHWRYLTTWNVVEFKGPTVHPRMRDLDALVELGLGIDRRLNEERIRERQRVLERAEVSFWYLANHLGRRFRAEAERLLGPLEVLGPGLWRGEVLERSMFLVSSNELPINADSIPLHLLNQGSVENELALARVLLSERRFWELYGPWLRFYHPEIREEVERMATKSRMKPIMDIRPVIEMVGLEQAIDQIGLDRVINQIGLDRVIEAKGVDWILDAKGVDWFLERVSQEHRAALKNRLQ